MKKLLSVLLVMVFALTLGACNGDDPIADLQDQLDALQASLTELEGELTALEGVVVDLDGELSTLHTALNTLQAAYEALETSTGEDKALLEAHIVSLEQTLELVQLQVRVALGYETAHHGVGYDLVHGHYVGIAHVTVAKGVVIAATVDEYFLPYSWAVIGTFDPEEEVTPEDDQFFVAGVRSSYRIFAKYIVVAGYECVGAVSDADAGAQNPLYMCDIDGVDVEIEAWVAADEANAKAYAESFANFTTWATNDHNYIADENFDRHGTYETTDASARVHILKSIAPYWRTGVLGWLGNARETEKAVLGMDLSGEFVLVRGVGNLWTIDDEVSGATWSDFKDYFETLVRAYHNAITE